MELEAKLYGKDLFGNPVEQPSRGKIADNFTLPPFTVLNARDGFWQERKRAWIALGIQSELGRDGVKCYQIGDKVVWDVSRQALTWGGSDEMSDDQLNYYRKKNKLSPGGSPRPACDYSKKQRGNGAGRAIKTQQGVVEKGKSGLAGGQTGTSIFDPVLCELVYKWFCPKGGQIIDPFAGGSVRGIVASILGRRYWGCDLSEKQIEANKEQGLAICDMQPVWISGDALDAVPNDAPEADFIFSCPPYGDLEVYSDDPRDLSTMEHHTFIANYKRIIMRACNKLKRDRFACFVVGDFRDKSGNYRNFVSDTVAAFLEQGLNLYNEGVLVTSVGSLPIRINKQFRTGRKMGKTHQNILVFVKGDAKKATKVITDNE